VGGHRRFLVAALASAWIVLATPAEANAACEWVGSTAPVEDRVKAVLSQMTLDEEIAMVHNHYDASYTGYVPARPCSGRSPREPGTSRWRSRSR